MTEINKKNQEGGVVHAEAKPNLSVAFTAKVLNELAGSIGDFKVTDEHRRLIQGYWMGCDRAIQEAEKHRNASKNALPCTWNNVLIDSGFAQALVGFMRLGLDMNLSNHLWAIPMMDNKAGKYRLSFRIGFEGRKIVAKKYAYNKIVDIRAELVYKNDKFRVIKKSLNQPGDSYEFEIEDPFDRGTLKGGFVFIEYENPSHNTVFVMNNKQIDARKNKAQSNKFWEAWPEEMALKTIVHAACKTITIDPKKIDDEYRKLLAAEAREEGYSVAGEIAGKANAGDIIDTDARPIDSESLSIPHQDSAAKPVEMPFTGAIDAQAVKEPVEAASPIEPRTISPNEVPF